LAELYDWASEDLSAIEANIADCDRAIKEVERRLPKTDEDPSDIRFYRYYLQLNKEAKDEIIDVLTTKINYGGKPFVLHTDLTQWFPA